jgi:hypothetical protein
VVTGEAKTEQQPLQNAEVVLPFPTIGMFLQMALHPVPCLLTLWTINNDRALETRGNTSRPFPVSSLQLLTET